MRSIPLTVLLALACAACSASPPPPDVPATAEPATPQPPLTPSAQPSAEITGKQPSAPAPTACGELDCQLFDSPEAAFQALLKKSPKVLAVGESHAQKGSEAIRSATHRFREQLLPLLKDRASDLVIELMVADGKCGQDEKKVAEVQKPATDRQAGSNQNEFVLLGTKSKSLGIRPHVLHPSCDDYKAVVKAGPNGIEQMLTMITDLTADLTQRLLKRNAEAGQDKLVVAYGGAMHNDVAPRPGREPFSFGPKLSALTKNRYLELDLIVPEFIKDNASWRALPWHPHFDRTAHPDKVTLFNPAPGAYVLIFAASQ